MTDNRNDFKMAVTYFIKKFYVDSQFPASFKYPPTHDGFCALQREVIIRVASLVGCYYWTGPVRTTPEPV